MAKVISINSSKKKGVVKTPIDKGNFMKDHGLKDDAHAGPWHRQVSLLGLESFDKLAKLGDLKDLKPGVFAENITTEGLILYELPLGTKLKIGKMILEVTQIGKECHHGCEIFHKVGDCVMPREGIFTRVLEAGSITPGEIIEVIE